jgi:hypothetical protein
VIVILFCHFQRKPSYELGIEINIKIEENNAMLELIQKQEYLTLEENVSTLVEDQRHNERSSLPC